MTRQARYNGTIARIFTALSATSTIVVSGCASPFDDARVDAWESSDPATWQVGRSTTIHDQRTLLGRTANQTSVGNAHMDPFGETLEVQALVQLALEYNPSIRAAEHRVERLGAVVPQVTSLDDPMFQIAPLGDMAETAAGQVDLMTGISQKFPFPGKLAARGEIAEQQVAMALMDLQSTRLQVIADTRQAFWSFYDATRAIETLEKSRALLEQLRQVAETLYAAGMRSQADVLRASLELSELDKELILLRKRQSTARGMLNQMIDRPVTSPVPQPAPTEPARVTKRLETFLELASQENPTIRKIVERIEMFREQRTLAGLTRWPDLTVSVNYSAVDNNGRAPSSNGEDQWWFGFGFNLPIWEEKYRAAEREAVRGILESVADLSAERNKAAFKVQEAYLKVEAQQEIIDLINDVIVPQAEQTVQSSASGYRAGRVDFLTLIDSWRKLLNFELMLHRATAELGQAVADLERAVGATVTSEAKDEAEAAPQAGGSEEADLPNHATTTTSDEDANNDDG